MIKIKFINGVNGSPVDWSSYLLDCGPINRLVESDNPGEAGLIVYDNVSLSFNCETGNPVYNAFGAGLSSATVYLFEIYGIKTTKEEIKIYEGAADFTTIEWDMSEHVIMFDVVDKIKAIDFLTPDSSQRSAAVDAKERLGISGDYCFKICSPEPPAGQSSLWYRIDTYLINYGVNNSVSIGNIIPHTQPVLQKGEVFFHPRSTNDNLLKYLVIDSILAADEDGVMGTYVRILPEKFCRLLFGISASDTIITLSGKIFEEGDYFYLEKEGKHETCRVTSIEAGSDVSQIYTIERLSGSNHYSWDENDKVSFLDMNLLYIPPSNLNSAPNYSKEVSGILASTFHLLYYNKSYYNIEDIGIYGNDYSGRNVLLSFDALKIFKGIISNAYEPINLINRYGSEDCPVSLYYYLKLVDAYPFGKHPIEALKLLVDSMQCYLFTDKQGNFVLQRKNNLGTTGSGTNRNIDKSRIISLTQKYFWDKIIDGIDIKLTIWNDSSFEAKRQIFSNIKPRNELSKEIIALNPDEFTYFTLNTLAGAVASEYLDFYGRRHYANSAILSLNDDLLEWELLDYVTDTIALSSEMKTFFLTSVVIDLLKREVTLEMISSEGFGYYKGQANIPLSISNYLNSSGS